MSNYRIEKWSELYPPQAAMMRLMLTQEGYRVNQWCDQPQRFHVKHKHEEDQTHWIISGVLEITVERVGTFILEAGDRDFLPAETYHSVRVLGDEAVMYLVGEKI